MKLWNAMMFYAVKKRADCPWTDSFVKQCRGGIEYAELLGIPHDKTKGQPNQGYHFLESYCYQKIRKGKLLYRVDPLDAPMEKIYNGLLCVELILWLAEVSGSDEEYKKKIQKVTQKAIEICMNEDIPLKDRKRDAREMIRTEIPWSTIESNIRKDEINEMLVDDDKLVYWE